MIAKMKSASILHPAIIAIVVSAGGASTMTRRVLSETEARLGQHSYSIPHRLPNFARRLRKDLDQPKSQGSHPRAHQLARLELTLSGTSGIEEWNRQESLGHLRRKSRLCRDDWAKLGGFLCHRFGGISQSRASNSDWNTFE